MQDRIYRVNGRMLLPAAGAVVLLLIGGYFQFVNELEMSATTALSTCLGIAAAAGLTWLGLYRRLTTVVSAADVTVRNLVRTRRIPWSRVQDIRVEINPGSLVESKAPKEMVIAYLSDGSRLNLPNVNGRNFTGLGMSLETEVEAIRAAWTRGRGARWTPVPAVQAKAAQRAHYRVSPMVLGTLAFMGSMAATAVLILLLLVVGLLDKTPGELIAVLFVAPFAILVITPIVSAVRRRRRLADFVPDQPSATE